MKRNHTYFYILLFFTFFNPLNSVKGTPIARSMPTSTPVSRAIFDIERTEKQLKQLNDEYMLAMRVDIALFKLYKMNPVAFDKEQSNQRLAFNLAKTVEYVNSMKRAYPFLDAEDLSGAKKYTQYKQNKSKEIFEHVKGLERAISKSMRLNIHQHPHYSSFLNHAKQAYEKLTSIVDRFNSLLDERNESIRCILNYRLHYRRQSIPPPVDLSQVNYSEMYRFQIRQVLTDYKNYEVGIEELTQPTVLDSIEHTQADKKLLLQRTKNQLEAPKEQSEVTKLNTPSTNVPYFVECVNSSKKPLTSKTESSSSSSSAKPQNLDLTQTTHSETHEVAVNKAYSASENPGIKDNKKDEQKKHSKPCYADTSSDETKLQTDLGVQHKTTKIWGNIPVIILIVLCIVIICVVGYKFYTSYSQRIILKNSPWYTRSMRKLNPFNNKRLKKMFNSVGLNLENLYDRLTYSIKRLKNKVTELFSYR